MIKDSKILIEKVRIILEHHKELEKAKGEKYNIFSVLKMESKENETHSAFLASLLDTKGDHLMGNIFLKLFIEHVLAQKSEFKFDIETAQCKVEHFIGKRDNEQKTGGRIDIYLWDKDGHSISVENKIYAGDQEAQIERYCNHNKNKNCVIYLTLYGEEPSNISKGELVCSRDFYLMSYQFDLLEWLNKCLKEAVNHEILRGSIKQYILLIKKLTNRMDNTLDNQMMRLLIEHNDEAEAIANNIYSARAKVGDIVRLRIEDKLSKSEWLDNIKCFETDTYSEGSVSNKPQYFMTIFIYAQRTKDNKDCIWLGIEGFSGRGHQGGRGFIGVHLDSMVKDIKNYNESEKLYGWHEIQWLGDFEGIEIDFSNKEFLKKIIEDNSDFVNRLSDHIIKLFTTYADNVLQNEL